MADTGQTATPKPKAPEPNRGPRLDLQDVKAFVIAGHGDMEKVKTMLAEQPKLINAAWDWGGGDWETALGGAAHTGHREIALFLLEKGARIDLFAATMLGRLEIVKSVLEAFPDAIHVLGPHGIPLSAHAKVGGAEAEAVADYLAARIAVQS